MSVKDKAIYIKMKKIINNLIELDFGFYLLFFVLLGTVTYEYVCLERLMQDMQWPVPYFNTSIVFYSLLCVPMLLLRKKLNNIFRGGVILFFLFPIILHIWCIENYSVYFNERLVPLLSTVSWREVYLFLTDEITTKQWLLFLILIVSMGCLLWGGFFFQPQKHTGIHFLLLCVPFVFWSMHLFWASSGAISIGKVPISGTFALSEAIRLGVKQNKISLKTIFPATIRRQATTDDVLGVIVIGESVTRSYMSLYNENVGPTTPNLCKRRNELCFFTNAISATVSTGECHVAMFTVFDSPKKQIRYAYIEPILRKEGIRTAYYYTLYQAIDFYDSITYTIFKNCSPYFLLGKHQRFPWYDIDLIPYLNKEIKQSEKNKPKAVFVQMLGSHVPFTLGYPKEFSYFSKTDKTIENAYKDSIRYSDLFLEEVIQILEKTDKPAFLLFVSDHGEARQYGAKLRDKKHPSCYEIPLLLWGNKAYRELAVDVFENAQRNAHKPYITSSLSYSICTLFGITWDNFPKEADLLNRSFVSQEQFPDFQRYLHFCSEKNKMGK